MLIHRIFESVVRAGRERFDANLTVPAGKFDLHFPNMSTVNITSTYVQSTIEPLQGQRVDTDYVTVKTGSETVSYSRNQLLSLRKTHPISDEVYHKIKELGISKHRRGRRAGRHVRKHVQVVHSDHRTKQLKGSGGGVNSSNLVNIHSDCNTKLDIHYWNAQSIGNKTTTVYDYLLDKDVDVFVITETWLGEEEPVIIGECTPLGYSFFNFPRPGDKHGGIAFICKSSLKLTISPTPLDTVTFEHASMTDNSKTFRLTAVYRPPPSKVNGFKYNQFMEEFDDFLGVLSTLPGKPLLMGDINIHVNKPSKPDVSRYLSSLEEHDMKQYVNKPTHRSGNILDHVICRPEDNLLLPQASCVVTPFRYGSDHHMIQCKINKSKPLPERRVLTARSYKDLDMSAFTSDLGEETRCILSLDYSDSQVEMYNTSIREVLDKHCPEKTRSQKLINNPKWYNDDVRDARRERRRTERRWRKIRLNEDRDKFIAQNNKVTELIKNVKRSYFKETLENANAKTMYSTLNMLLNSTGKKLPACSSNTVLSNQFACYFSDKVDNIRSELDEMGVTNELDNDVCDSTMYKVYKDKCNISDECVLENFDDVDEEEVRKIIAKLPDKTSPLDSFPTWLLKRCVDTLLPVITSIINNSFRSGSFPRTLRQAVVTSLIKKPTLNPDLLKNYRPVSNLPTLGKIIEYPAVSRLKNYLQVNNFTETYQSAYKSSHSTETALLRVKHDVLKELDKG